MSVRTYQSLFVKEDEVFANPTNYRQPPGNLQNHAISAQRAPIFWAAFNDSARETCIQSPYEPGRRVAEYGSHLKMSRTVHKFQSTFLCIRKTIGSRRCPLDAIPILCTQAGCWARCGTHTASHAAYEKEHARVQRTETFSVSSTTLAQNMKEKKTFHFIFYKRNT